MALQHFLILYSLKEAKLLHMQKFGDEVDRATAAYAELEREYRGRDDYEDFEIRGPQRGRCRKNASSMSWA